MTHAQLLREGLRNLPWGKVTGEGELRGVEGAEDAAPAPVEDVGVDHGGANVLVAQ